MIRRRQGQLSIDDLLAFGPHRSARELLAPKLRRIDEVLDDSELVDEVFSMLAERHAGSRETGRPGTPAEVVLRMLVLKHLKGWSYAELEWEVRGSLAYRFFCRVGMGKVPDEKTLVRLGHSSRASGSIACSTGSSRSRSSARLPVAAACAWTRRWLNRRFAHPPTVVCARTAFGFCSAG